MFCVWLGREQRTPPCHDHNEGVNPRRSPEPDARYPAGGADLGPPLSDMTAEYLDVDPIVLTVVVTVLEEWLDNSRPFLYWETCWGLDIMSVLPGESHGNTYNIWKIE